MKLLELLKDFIKINSSTKASANEANLYCEKWHGDDEYVTFKSVELYKEILVQFAKDFA